VIDAIFVPADREKPLLSFLPATLYTSGYTDHQLIGRDKVSALSDNNLSGQASLRRSVVNLGRM
jgi:hypothetical protein